MKVVSKTKMFLEQLEMHHQENEWFASFEQALNGVTAAEAAWAGPGNSNSIWQIANHLIFWNDDVIHRINGTENPHKPKDNEETFGNPGDPEDVTGWSQTVQRLNEVISEMKSVIENLDDERLSTSYAPNRYSIERLLSNVMMHDTYHLGQIVLLQKLQSSWRGVD